MKLYRKDDDGTYHEVEGALTLETHKSKLGAKAARIEALEAELTEARKTMTEALDLAEAARAEVDQAKVLRTEDVALVRAGIDDELGMATARLAWSRLPEDGRGSLVDTVANWASQPDGAPKALRPYLAEPASTEAPAPAPAATEAIEAPRATLPRSNNGAQQHPSDTSLRWTPERIRAAVADGSYAQHRDEIARDLANPGNAR